MKKIIMLAFVAFVTLVVSCGKDDNESLEGTWLADSLSYNGEAETLDACDKKSFMTFSGSTYSEADYYEGTNGECVEEISETGTYSISNDVLTIVNSTGESTSFSYSISENTLTLTLKTIEYTGKELTIVTVWKKK